MTDLVGLKAIVTGAASGIGEATANLLTSRRATATRLDLAFPQSDIRSLRWNVDLTDDEAVKQIVDECAAAMDGIDILINVAGIAAVGPVESNPSTEWARVFDVNVTSIARVTSAALPALRDSRDPAIVNVASIAATAGLPNRALYSASKGAVLALTRAMAADLVSDRIRVNSVSPGTADTPWVQRLLAASDGPEDLRRQLEQRQPMGRLASAEEVAEAIVFIASPAAGFITGSDLQVDGGMYGLRLPR